MRSALSLVSLVALLTVSSTRANAQDTAVRFSVTAVADTTFSFRVGEHLWVRSGLRGIVVDPRQQDMLVARFEVIEVASGTARAVITGETTPVSTQHAALLTIPKPAWYRQGAFWIGTGLGAVIGAAIGLLAGG
jgi:hypothetical protein